MSFTALSPAQQGDAFSGLTLAIAGVGPDGVQHLPTGATRPQVGPADAWATPFLSETGQYVLLSQDCDLVREPADEPTVQIAPLVLIDQGEWQDLNRNGYSARQYAYPSAKFSGVPDSKGLAVDLAWTTSILKGSLSAPGVTATRPLTGPEQRAFTEWVAARTGRVPFPDAVVTNVLDPCYHVRRRLLAAFNKAAGPTNAKVEARVVAAVDRWYAHVDGHLLTILGSLTGPRLQAAGLTDPTTGQVLVDDLTNGITKLQTQVIGAMNRVNPDSGYTLKINCMDLATVRADRFLQFSALMR
ncbi:hypothetical protein [Modestobacter sp. SYSU DS0875]